MVEFLWKIENHGIKISRVNSILITKSFYLHLFTKICYGVGSPFKLTAIARSIYREVYDHSTTYTLSRVIKYFLL